MNKLKILSAFAFALAFAGTSFAADEEIIIGKYGAITIKKVMVEGLNNGKKERTVAYIDDSSDETPVITEDIEVDSVYYSRKFNKGYNVFSTLMFPFDLSNTSWKFGFQVYAFVSIEKSQNNNTEYKITVEEGGPLKANTPYIVEQYNTDYISFNTDYLDSKKETVTLNTTTNSRQTSFTSGGYNWDIIGTYERIEFKKPKGIYGFAAREKNNTKIGQFTKAACNDTSCAYIRPFRAYLKCTLPKASAIKGLAKSADDVASLDDLPKTIEVHVIKKDGSRTYLGTLITYTGEITVDDRWFDMKGRRLQHKPTAKGTYYNNRKKVVIK